MIMHKVRFRYSWSPKAFKEVEISHKGKQTIMTKASTEGIEWIGFSDDGTLTITIANNFTIRIIEDGDIYVEEESHDEISLQQST